MIRSVDWRVLERTPSVSNLPQKSVDLHSPDQHVRHALFGMTLLSQWPAPLSFARRLQELHLDRQKARRVTHPSRAGTVHGFRSTFRDWAAEQTSFPGEIAEMCLAHLEHFPAKWTPVCVAKMRPNKEIEPRSDSIGTEKALVCSKVERAYRRTELLAKRRELLTAWADYCGERGGGEALRLAAGHQAST